MANAHTRRDSNLPLTQMRHKANPPVLEEGIKKYIGLLKGDPKIAAQYMEGGSLADLACYADRNTAVTGYLMDTLFGGLRGLATREVGGFPNDCRLCVTIKVDNLESTKKTFSSNMREYEHDEGTGHTKRRGTEWTGYGANCVVLITMEFRSDRHGDFAPTSAKLEFEQRLTIEPDRDCRSPYTRETLQPPPAQEFAIGAVVNLLHSNKRLTDAELRQMVVIAERNHVFPRHNASVRAIEAALEQLGPFVDTVVRYLASLPPFRAAASRQSLVAMPWGPARHEILKQEGSEGDAAMSEAANGDATTEHIGDKLGRALDQFHADQCNALIGGMGVLGDLMQRLLLLKSYATHFADCYASIDHYMVRSFMRGIGEHNAVLFEKREPLDPLLAKIALFQASRAGVEVTNAEIDVIGCSVNVEIKMPGKAIFEPLKGIPAVEPDFEGELRFGGLGSKGVAVAGEYTRHVFVLPTESDGGAKPAMRVKAQTEYANPPVIVVIGTPDGKCTNAKATFLLVDTWCVRLAIEVGAIPSNKAFAKAMSILPPEMADFAAAIRACDVAEGGLDLHVIHLLPLLASALGVDEGDLMGDPDWTTQLVGLMRGGVSLQSLAQGTKTSPTHDLAKMKAETAKLEKRMLAQGAIDHYKPPPAHAEQPRFTSLSAHDDAYRSLGSGVAAAEVAPMAVEASAPTTAPAESGGGGDAAVEALAEGLEDLKSDDRDFVGTLLKHSEKTIANSEAVLGATLSIPDCETGCVFSKGRVPDFKVTSDFMGPSDDDKWEIRPNLGAASKTIQRMLRAHTGPVPTTRLAVFGVFVEWETNLLTGLMSGSTDPTKNLLEAFRAMATLQR